MGAWRYRWDNNYYWSLLGLLLLASPVLTFSQTVQTSIASKIPSSVNEGSTIAMVRFWSLIDFAFKPSQVASLTIPAQMLRSEKGAHGPSRLIFPSSTLEATGRWALAVQALNYRTVTSASPPVQCEQDDYDKFTDCCTKAPTLSCLSSGKLYPSVFPGLRSKLIAATAMDLIASELSPATISITLSKLTDRQLAGDKTYFIAGFTPGTNNESFLAIELTGSRLEALSELLRVSESIIANSENQLPVSSQAYVCREGKWAAFDAAFVPKFEIASSKPLSIRSLGGESNYSLGIGEKDGSLVIYFRPHSPVSTHVFMDVLTDVALRNALLACMDKGFEETIKNQPGLLNLLRDKELSLFIAHSLYLGAFWEATGGL